MLTNTSLVWRVVLTELSALVNFDGHECCNHLHLIHELIPVGIVLSFAEALELFEYHMDWLSSGHIEPIINDALRAFCKPICSDIHERLLWLTDHQRPIVDDIDDAFRH